MKKIYNQLTRLPEDLTFDEESLFWRLRMGEGLPTREWHKPLERHKTWEEIKAGLDQKLFQTRSAMSSIYKHQKGMLKRFMDRLKAFFI